MVEERPKYLVETSALLPAIGASTASQCRHYADVVRDGTAWTSVYISKEFIWAFFCELAYAAFFISQRTSVKDALVVLANRFSIRNIKVDLIALATLLESNRAMHSPSIAAEELGSLAIKWLKTFDREFKQRIPNELGCRIGHKRPGIDYDTMLQDLHEFYADFAEPVDDCPVNDFLGIGDPDGRGQKLVSQAETKKLDAVRNLAKLLEKGSRFVCDECKKIGDALIALEQPEDLCLVHSDHAYNKFCHALERTHKPIKSVIALDNENMAGAMKPRTG
jgi:hypothetical protein